MRTSPSARFAPKSSNVLGLGVAVNANSERLGTCPRLTASARARLSTSSSADSEPRILSLRLIQILGREDGFERFGALARL